MDGSTLAAGNDRSKVETASRPESSGCDATSHHLTSKIWYENAGCAPPMTNTQKPVLLYDGVCGFCNKTVQFILKHDRNGTVLFSPLQGQYAKTVLKNHPEAQNIDS